MAVDLHCVMQDTADAEQVGTDMPVKQKMAWTKDDAMLVLSPLPAISQMI
jgi:hypothetical protein